MKRLLARLGLVCAVASLASLLVPGVALAAPRITVLKNTGPIAYELKSLQTTRFYTSVDTANVWAVLKVRTATGDIVLFRGAIPTANKTFYFPTWNGRTRDGRSLPTATYDYSLTVSKGGQSATRTGKIIVSRICFSRSNTWQSWAEEENIEYGYCIAGNANVYVQATSAYAVNTFTMLVTREHEGGGYEQLLLDEVPFGSAAPLKRTIYVRSGRAVPSRGICDFFLWGTRDLKYSFTWIQ